MHGCDHSISCLDATAYRIGSGMEINALRCGGDIHATAYRIGDYIHVTASVVCSVNKDAYLQVEPDVVWLTSDMLSGEFDIYSNVVWKIY